MIVWLASFPRSGNTFFRVMLNSLFAIKTHSLYDDRTDIGADEQTSTVVGHEFLPEDFDLQRARASEQVFYIKTHELMDHRVQPEDKVIYLVRDGRESTLSLMKHLKHYGGKHLCFRDLVYGNNFAGSWGDHLRSWQPLVRENMLLVHFERLISEPLEYAARLAEFLAVQPVGEALPSFAELQAINPKFFRSGKTDSWRTQLSEAEHLAFWLKNHQTMLEYGYDSYQPAGLGQLEQQPLIAEVVAQNHYLLNLQLCKSDRKTDRQVHDALEQVRLREVLERRDVELGRLREVLERRNEEQGRLREVLERRDVELGRLREVLERRDVELDRLREVLERRDVELGRLREVLERRNEEQGRLREALSRRDEQLSDKSAVCERLQAELVDVSTQLQYLQGCVREFMQTTAGRQPLRKLSAYRELLRVFEKIDFDK